jgi:FkbM family methyltransferase
MEKVNGFYTMPDDPINWRLSLLLGQHETETLNLMKELLKPGMVVVDVGANVGCYTRLFAKLVGKTGKVIAFEPHPRTFETLSTNVRNFNNVVPLQIAVSERDGESILYDTCSDSGSSSLAFQFKKRDVVKGLIGRELAPNVRNGVPVRTYNVRTASLDSVLGSMNVGHVDVMKVDVEGAEILALKGMMRTLNRNPQIKLIIEWAPLNLQAFGATTEKLLTALRGLRFNRIRVIGTNSPIDFDWKFSLSANFTGAYVNVLCERI